MIRGSCFRDARAGHQPYDIPDTAACAGHHSCDLHAPPARAGHRSAAIHTALARAGQPHFDAHHFDACAGGASAMRDETLLFTIRSLGRTLDDLEHLRIQTGNRIGAGEREYGEALPHLYATVERLKEVEHFAELELKRAWRHHELAPWAAGIPGCGEKLMARLIAAIGDPAERPNVAKLWAYCGVGDPLRKRRSGMSQEEAFRLGNPEAKKATWKLAFQFMRTTCKTHTAEKKRRDAEDEKGWFPPPPGCTCATDNPYRVLYDERRVATEDRLHTSACLRCGPAGHPALPGSPWSDAHRHADALRVVGKRFLVDLWVEARRLRTLEEVAA